MKLLSKPVTTSNRGSVKTEAKWSTLTFKNFGKEREEGSQVTVTRTVLTTGVSYRSSDGVTMSNPSSQVGEPLSYTTRSVKRSPPEMTAQVRCHHSTQTSSFAWSSTGQLSRGAPRIKGSCCLLAGCCVLSRVTRSLPSKQSTCETIIIIIIIIAFKGAIRDFLQSPHSAANCLQHARSSGPGAIVCKSRATHRALMTRKRHVTGHLVRRDSSAIKFDRVEIAFI